MVVRGNVLLDYSMDQTIYFPALTSYKGATWPGDPVRRPSTPVTVAPVTQGGLRWALQ